MITFETILAANPTSEQLAEFKEYASVNAGSDTLLASMLKSAFLAVGEWEDVSLLVCSCRVSVTERECAYEPVRLFGTPDEIDSIQDGRGEEMDGTLVGKDVILAGGAESVAVTYTTKVDAGSLSRLLPKVYRYATALYDGEDSQGLNRILTERC